MICVGALGKFARATECDTDSMNDVLSSGCVKCVNCICLVFVSHELLSRDYAQQLSDEH